MLCDLMLRSLALRPVSQRHSATVSKGALPSLALFFSGMPDRQMSARVLYLYASELRSEGLSRTGACYLVPHQAMVGAAGGLSQRTRALQLHSQSKCYPEGP